MASFNQTVYQYTNGKYSLGPQDGTSGSFAKTVGQAANQVATKDLKTEENTVYENQKRVERTMAVASLISADYKQVFETNNYKNMMSSVSQSNVGSSWLSQIGYAGNASNNIAALSQHTFNYTDASGAVKNYTPSLPLNSGQIQSLAENGTCMINGMRCTVSDMSKTDVIKHANSILNDMNHTNHLLNVTNKNDMIYEMSKVRNTSLSYIKNEAGNDSILAKNIGYGTSRDIGNVQKQLDLKKSELLDKLKKDPHNVSLKKELTDIQKQSDLLNNHVKNVGFSDHATRGGLTGQQKYGLSIIGQKMTGDDMTRGYRFTKQTFAVTRAGARIAYGLSMNAATGITHIGAGMASRVAPNSNITSGLKNAALHTKDKNDLRKKYNQLRKTDGCKAVREAKQAKRNEDRGLRNARKDARLDDKINKHKQQGNTNKVNKLERKKERRLASKNRRASRHDFFNSVGTRWSNFKKKTHEFFENSPFGKIKKIYDAVANPIKATVSLVKEKIKAAIIKYIAPVLFWFLVVFLIIMLMCTIISVLGAYFASDEVDNTNYTQKIVDDIAEDMAKKYVLLAKRDATLHFTVADTAPVSGYSKNGDFTGTTINGGEGIKWHKSPNKGTIGDITSWDGSRKLASINSNLLQITSMMHARFCNVIDKDNYLTAKAYMYYMFAHSHDVSSYDYKDIDDCAPENLYASPITAGYWNATEKKLNRPDEICSNIYLHGYSLDTVSSKFSSAMNTIFSSAYKIGKKFMNGKSTYVLDKFAGKTEGIWVDEIPSDAVGNCHNYVAAVYSTVEYEDEDGWHSELLCGQRPHIHDASCYELICDEKDTPCTMPGDCDAEPGEPGYHICNSSKHTHKDGPPPDYQSLDDGDYNECWKLTCDIPAHDHIAWFEPYTDEDGNYHESCYSTVYICKGHCGGHIQPVINLKVADDWETLMKKDNGRIALFVTNDTFNEGIVEKGFSETSLSAFQTYWSNKTSSWYILSWSGITDKNKADVNDFTGWKDQDTGTYDEQVDFMTGLYGSVDDKFKDGIENWKAMEVTFPIGGGTPLSEAEIESYMEELLAANPGLSDSRQAAIRKAMEYVGMFWYDLQNPGTMYAEEGRIDCSGFISSVLYHAEIGFANDWTASGYSGSGFPRPSSMVAGDILSKNLNSYAGAWTGDGSSNHVIMYIGHLSDGPDGEGEYIIDCSSSQGGSCLRKMSDFGSYKYCYRGCY